ncbi:carbohydrate-binding module family 13 protein [Rhizophagus irregularis DAOM 181602=DAOM 197198]|nr:carbohydrate-binding module family 13 protein [Rhizophagus irregularis DAOM 181602=DAOM 197198]
MNDNILTKLSQNLLEILNDEEYYDVTIEVGNDPYIKIFHAHMVILHDRSNYLRRILSINKKENKETLVHIKLPNISPEIFQIILRYIYGGEISLEEYDTSDIMDILIAGSKLGLQELITYSQSFLIETKTNWMEQNFSLIYQTSFENDSFLELQKFCTSLITKKPNKIFRSSSFSSIPGKLLVLLIQSDNLQMSEIQVWQHMLNWGLAQNPELPSDPTNFTKEDFNTLKNSLQHCIPHIKLYKDLLKYFLNPNGQLSIPRIVADSKIITPQHVELISKWIDRLEITDEIKNTYEFKLLLRGSHDGFSPKKFHEICDNQSHTVTIIKVKNSKEILGGYNPSEWKSDGSNCTTKDSFIFSFKNDDIKSYILSRVKDERHAVSNDRGLGPSFGVDLFLMKPLIFRAHMVILHYRSTCLRRILSTNKRKNDGTLFHIKLQNILPEIFQIILRYIYSGRITLEEYDTSDIIKILVAGSELGLQELITYLQSFLIKTKANWMEQNFNLIYQISFEDDSFLELQKFCTDLTSKEPDKLFKSLKFSSIPEKLLVSLNPSMGTCA